MRRGPGTRFRSVDVKANISFRVGIQLYEMGTGFIKPARTARQKGSVIVDTGDFSLTWLNGFRLCLLLSTMKLLL